MKRYDANVFFPGCLGPLNREVVLADDAAKLEAEAQALREEVAALRARVVVMPDSILPHRERSIVDPGFNEALRQVARLNGKAVSEGLLRGLAAFTLELVRGAGEGCSFDGAEIQEGAERHGLLTKRVMERPCCGPDDGYCSCAYCAEFPTECYQIKPELRDLS